MLLSRVARVGTRTVHLLLLRRLCRLLVLLVVVETEGLVHLDVLVHVRLLERGRRLVIGDRAGRLTP